MPLTDDFSFKLGDSGVILNSNTSSPPLVEIRNVKGLDSSEYRESDRDHEGTDGGFKDAEFEKGRPVVLGGTIFGSPGDDETFLDSLKANFAPSKILVPLYFKPPGKAERLLFVKPLGVRYDWELLRSIGFTDVQFLMYAEMPHIFDSQLQTISIPLGAQTFSGFGFSFGFDFGFGGTSTTSDGQMVTNGGNRPTPIVFTIPGPVTDPLILNDTTSMTMQFSIDIASGDYLVVDTYYRTVKLTGITNRRNTLQAPNWFNLEPGGNFIRYRASSVGTSNLSVQFRNAWR